MLKAGVPIVTCLQMMVSESTALGLRKIINSVTHDVSSGQTLSHALSKYKKVFGFFCLNIIAIGERSGTLPENLEYLAIELKKKHELRTQIMGALIYPAIVVIATIGITIFLVVYIFPKIVPIFLSVKTTLPMSTQFLIAVSDFLSIYGWYLICCLVLSIVTVPLCLRIPKVAYFITLCIVRMPVVGALSRYYNLSQIARTLGLLLRSGISISEALVITTHSTSNVVYQKKLHDLQTHIASGKVLSAELQKNTFLFPTMCIQMIEVGEKTGNMTTTLAYLSELYESDIRDLTKNLTTIVEPILMLCMGLIVGFIAISIITPIYGITQNLQ
jgi:type IV pilus assembly protein PilC